MSQVFCTLNDGPPRSKATSAWFVWLLQDVAPFYRMPRVARYLAFPSPKMSVLHAMSIVTAAAL